MHGNGKNNTFTMVTSQTESLYKLALFSVGREFSDPSGKRRVYKMAAKIVYTYYSGATMTNTNWAIRARLKTPGSKRNSAG